MGPLGGRVEGVGLTVWDITYSPIVQSIRAQRGRGGSLLYWRVFLSCLDELEVLQRKIVCVVVIE